MTISLPFVWILLTVSDMWNKIVTWSADLLQISKIRYIEH